MNSILISLDFLSPFLYKKIYNFYFVFFFGSRIFTHLFKNNKVNMIWHNHKFWTNWHMSEKYQVNENRNYRVLTIWLAQNLATQDDSRKNLWVVWLGNKLSQNFNVIIIHGLNSVKLFNGYIFIHWTKKIYGCNIKLKCVWCIRDKLR